ncbi:hypothetical protein Tco_0105423 [Tanacetum coccineum]
MGRGLEPVVMSGLLGSLFFDGEQRVRQSGSFAEPSSAFESSLRCRKTKSGPQDTRVCTVMLTVKSEFVTVGMFRVFGEETAELSIVAISEPYKQKIPTERDKPKWSYK